MSITLQFFKSSKKDIQKINNRHANIFGWEKKNKTGQSVHDFLPHLCQVIGPEALSV